MRALCRMLYAIKWLRTRFFYRRANLCLQMPGSGLDSTIRDPFQSGSRQARSSFGGMSAIGTHHDRKWLPGQRGRGRWSARLDSRSWSRSPDHVRALSRSNHVGPVTVAWKASTSSSGGVFPVPSSSSSSSLAEGRMDRQWISEYAYVSSPPSSAAEMRATRDVDSLSDRVPRSPLHPDA